MDLRWGVGARRLNYSAIVWFRSFRGISLTPQLLSPQLLLSTQFLYHRLNPDFVRFGLEVLRDQARSCHF